MNLRQTAEVAALVATSASHLIESSRPIPTAALHGYWKQSRTRLKCWFAALQTSSTAGEASSWSVASPQLTQKIEVCREILVTEMLTRVWSTVLLASDRRQGSDRSRAAVDSVFRGHQEARHQVLQRLADDSLLPLADQISLDRFRRRIERWTDALIGPLAATYGVGDFAFDERRARDFAESAAQQALRGTSEALTPLLLAGVTAAFPPDGDAESERAMLNRSIVRSILAAYPAEAFGNDGRLRSASQGQIERSSRHPESAAGGSTGGIGLSFIELRRRERSIKER